MSLRILLCLDGSSFGDAASRVALQLQRIPNAKVTVLHVLNVTAGTGSILRDLPGRLGFEPVVVSSDVATQYAERGKALLEEVRRDFEIAGYEAEIVLDTGAVAERIAHHARHADLVIMGLRGTTEDKHPGQGGGSLEAVLSGVETPIFFATKDIRRITGVALGYDGSIGASRALTAAKSIVEPLNLPLHTIYVSPDGGGGEILDEVVEQLPNVDVQRHLVMDEEPHRALLGVAEACEANVLSLGFRGTSKLKDFFYGSAAQEIVMHATTSVMVAY